MLTVYSQRLQVPALPRSRSTTLLVFVALAAYLIVVRTWNVSDSFLMLRDQIRDWRFALGPFTALPLTGTQSTAGGSSLGPVYYWLLWIIRHTVGPFTSYQPHAGAIGLTLLQTAADLTFLHAVRTRTGSLWLALATTLLVATTAHDLAIASTIWNPAVSVAMVKLAVAGVLLEPPLPTMLRMILVTIAAWLAVQAHSAALFIAAPLLGTYCLRDLGPGRLGAAFQRGRAIAEAILILQLPFLYYAFTHTSEAGPVRALGGAAQGLRLRDSTEALLQMSARIFAAPWTASWWSLILIASVIVVAVRARGDLRLLSVTVLPIVVTAVGFSIWQGAYDEYWYLPLAPCTGLTLALALTTWRPQQSAILLLLVMIAIQPWRVQLSRGMYRMPEYRALAHGAREIYRQTPTIRRIDTTFQMPGLSDRGFVYEAMGGRIVPEATFDALIDETGHVRFTPVR